jgi:toxin-antitoxin system PIN domain toxin
VRALLDVNVLVALIDSDHVHHRRARSWLEAEIDAGWASCPITQNGLIRILSQPRYPGSIPVARAIERLRAATSTPHHQHWSCDLSVLDRELFDRTRLHGPGQVTDAYLLALAIRNRGRFVTLDERVPVSAVRGAAGHHLVVL